MAFFIFPWKKLPSGININFYKSIQGRRNFILKIFIRTPFIYIYNIKNSYPYMYFAYKLRLISIIIFKRVVKDQRFD